MCIIKAKWAATFWMLLLLTQFLVFAQDTVRENSILQQKNPLGRVEVPDTEEQRRFVKEHSFDNPTFRQKQSEKANGEAALAGQGSKQVRMIYLVPSDKSVRADYQIAIASAISDLQGFYKDQLGGGYAFPMHSPIVEVFQTSHPSAFYSTGYNARPGGFYESVLSDGFALTGGGFNDPDNRWIFYIDADLICGQYTGGTSGIALLPANDLRGLTSQATVPVCPSDRSNILSVNRWVGGLGHELGHSFNLPHPPGCDNGNCAGGQYAYLSLMYIGYLYYPGTYLLDEDKAKLLAGGFFEVPKYDLGGVITESNKTGLAGVTVTINETRESFVSDANGTFSFTGLRSGGNYTIGVTKAGYRFTPSSVVFNHLDRNQTANFTGTLQTHKISGQIIDVNGSPVGDVEVKISGAQSLTVRSDKDGRFSFDDLVSDHSYSVTPFKANYTFSPQNQTFDNLGSDQTAYFTVIRSPDGPVLVTEPNSNRAMAVDSVTFLHDPFSVISNYNFSADRRTRIMLLTVNLNLLPGEDASVLKIQAEDSRGNVYLLPVEAVKKVPGFEWLTQVLVKLPDDLNNAGDILVNINLRGAVSNKGLISIAPPASVSP